MTRKHILLAAALLVAVSTASAQSLEAFRSRLAVPQTSAEQPDGACVTVTEHDDAAQAVSNASRSGQRNRLRGYRVCIFFDNGPTARADAMAAKELFRQTYPDVAVLWVYDNPYFKVSVGNCLTAEEAIILKGRVSQSFPKAFVKSEELTLSDFAEE